MEPNVPSDLSSARILGLPESFYYTPNFITEEEEATILQKIPANRWISLSKRRLQAHPTTLTANNTLLASPLSPFLADPILQRFEQLGIFQGSPHSTPNHVLINEYKPGEGIMPHEDGGAYWPVVATVSLSATLVLNVYRKRPKSQPDDGEPHGQGEANGDDDEEYNEPVARILQEPRSLLVTTGNAYRHLLHGIAPVEVDEDLGPGTIANWPLLGDSTVFDQGRNKRATRVSLTYRDVLKVSKAGSKILFGRR